MHRMCPIIYNGRQSTTPPDTWSIAQLYMKCKRASYTAPFKLKVIEPAEKCGNRAAGHARVLCEKLVRNWRKKKAELEALPLDKRLLTILSCFVDAHTHKGGLELDGSKLIIT